MKPCNVIKSAGLPIGVIVGDDTDVEGKLEGISDILVDVTATACPFMGSCYWRKVGFPICGLPTPMKALT